MSTLEEVLESAEEMLEDLKRKLEDAINNGNFQEQQRLRKK